MRLKWCDLIGSGGGWLKTNRWRRETKCDKEYLSQGSHLCRLSSFRSLLKQLKLKYCSRMNYILALFKFEVYFWASLYASSTSISTCTLASWWWYYDTLFILHASCCKISDWHQYSDLACRLALCIYSSLDDVTEFFSYKVSCLFQSYLTYN
jgi:hypothetical protein